MKRIKRNYETEFDRDFEFDDYGNISQTHPYRVLKVEKQKDTKEKNNKKEKQ